MPETQSTMPSLVRFALARARTPVLAPVWLAAGAAGHLLPRSALLSLCHLGCTMPSGEKRGHWPGQPVRSVLCHPRSGYSWLLNPNLNLSVLWLHRWAPRRPPVRSTSCRRGSCLPGRMLLLLLLETWSAVPPASQRLCCAVSLWTAPVPTRGGGTV